MSYDFSMYTTAGSTYKIYTELDLNYTYNVAPMFYDAIPGEEGIQTINGKKGHEVLKALELAYEKMTSEEQKYKNMNPKNGWGNYEGALEVIKILILYAKKYPKAIFEIT